MKMLVNFIMANCVQFYNFENMYENVVHSITIIDIIVLLFICIVTIDLCFIFINFDTTMQKFEKLRSFYKLSHIIHVTKQ